MQVTQQIAALTEHQQKTLFHSSIVQRLVNAYHTTSEAPTSTTTSASSAVLDVDNPLVADSVDKYMSYLLLGGGSHEGHGLEKLVQYMMKKLRSADDALQQACPSRFGGQGEDAATHSSSDNNNNHHNNQSMQC